MMRSLVLAWTIAAVLQVRAGNAPLPVELFSARPQIGQMELSPDGMTLAVLGDFKGVGYGLYAIDLQTLKPRQLLLPIDGLWVASVRWLDDDWITYEVVNEFGFWRGRRKLDVRAGSIVGARNWADQGCAYLDSVRAPPRRDGTAWMVCFGQKGDKLKVQDLASGEMKKIEGGDGGMDDYWLDHRGVARAARRCEQRAEAEDCRSYYRDDVGQPWAEIARWNTGDAGAVSPAGFDFDDRRLYVFANPEGGPWGLYAWDSTTRTLGPALYQDENFDVEGIVMSRHDRKLVGVRFDDGRHRVHWVDAGRAALEREMAKEFPGQSVNLWFADDGKRALVYVHSDRNPGEWHLFYSETGVLRFLSKRNPKLDPALMAEERPVSYKARDGLTIHGYLTLPPGVPPIKLPLIVNPHGGPYGIRDRWGFEPEVQFLASRGYAVLQINFRGSSGYGAEFLKAGWGQWGLKMQDDVTDGVRWAIAEGYVDADRVCIFGGSYGGYVALMGLVTTPELYRCGVTYAGVSDLVELYRSAMRVGATPWRGFRDYRVWMKRVIGRRWGNTKELAEVSPLQQADRIRAPLFIAHGRNDYTVPYEHAQRLKSKLDELGRVPEWMMLPEEGHGFRKPENVRAFYLKLEDFFGKHLAPRPPPEASAQR